MAADSRCGVPNDEPAVTSSSVKASSSRQTLARLCTRREGRRLVIVDPLRLGSLTANPTKRGGWPTRRGTAQHEARVQVPGCLRWSGIEGIPSKQRGSIVCEGNERAIPCVWWTWHPNNAGEQRHSKSALECTHRITHRSEISASGTCERKVSTSYDELKQRLSWHGYPSGLRRFLPTFSESLLTLAPSATPRRIISTSSSFVSKRS